MSKIRQNGSDNFWVCSWQSFTYRTCDISHTHTHTQLFYCSSGICPGLPGWAGTRKVKPGRLKPIWIYWNKREWVAVASAGPYASLHLIPDNHASVPSLIFLQAGCPSCCPTNCVKALKAKYCKTVVTIFGFGLGKVSHISHVTYHRLHRLCLCGRRQTCLRL